MKLVLEMGNNYSIRKYCKQLILGFCLMFVSTSLFAQLPAKPNPMKLVNILSSSSFISQSEIEYLERKLVAFDDSTSNQIAILVVDDLNGMDANQYATEVAHNWQIGVKGKDNGVLLLISLGKDGGKRYEFIAVGYGLEERIPDLMTKQVREAYLLPNLKSGNYFKALDETTTALMELAVGAYKDKRNKSKKKSPIWFFVFLIILWLIMRFGNKGNGGTTIGPRGIARGAFYGGFGGFGGGFGGGGGGGGGFGGFGGGGFGGGGSGGSW